jgi:hypothetical protein
VEKTRSCAVLPVFVPLLLLFTVDVTVTDEAGVRAMLPRTLGSAWSGDDVLFCQNPHCGRSWLTRQVTPDEAGLRICPENWQGEACGGELYTMSLGEKIALPADTVMLKKQYVKMDNPEETVFTSVVLSGRERSSIHRPEVCMVAQGNVIESREVISVPMQKGPPLKVMVMHLSRRFSPQYTRHSYYAYFFVGRDRTTPYHAERLIWMALDRIFRNVAHQWAYIAVSGERDADLENKEHYDEIRDVVSRLYPEISLLDNAK